MNQNNKEFRVLIYGFDKVDLSESFKINDIADKNTIISFEPYNTEKRFCDLPDQTRDPNQTHPKQIKHKLQEAGKLRVDDKTVYGSLQAVFNAKPDLAICTGNALLIYEAKYTLAFDQTQLERTEQIGAICSELLFRDLGFDTPPRVEVRKLGLQRYDPDVSWEQVHKIALAHWGGGDFSTIIF